jgi:hypothetical protein
MQKTKRLPHEQRNVGDGLPADGLTEGFLPTDSDVEGHNVPSGEGLGTQLPGTGGDFRKPSGGGELTEDDVEGHVMADELGSQLPGTGGDFRTPSSGGE